MDILYIVISLFFGFVIRSIRVSFSCLLKNKRIQESRLEGPNFKNENALKKETQLLIESKEKALNIVSKTERELKLENLILKI
ncbi:MAG: hypothetical protein CM1200mP33_1270 [Chloroflexota bacterium]|nr:MAG: hypothetical protein CM1200mP33_1270 [Chloroflexota bacterium]